MGRTSCGQIALVQLLWINKTTAQEIVSVCSTIYKIYCSNNPLIMLFPIGMHITHFKTPFNVKNDPWINYANIDNLDIYRYLNRYNLN